MVLAKRRIEFSHEVRYKITNGLTFLRDMGKISHTTYVMSDCMLMTLAIHEDDRYPVYGLDVPEIAEMFQLPESEVREVIRELDRVGAIKKPGHIIPEPGIDFSPTVALYDQLKDVQKERSDQMAVIRNNLPTYKKLMREYLKTLNKNQVYEKDTIVRFLDFVSHFPQPQSWMSYETLTFLKKTAEEVLPQDLLAGKLSTY